MSKSSAKWLIAVVLSVVALSAAGTAVAGISDLVVRPGSASDPMATLNTRGLPVDIRSVSWRPTEERLARPLDDAVRKSIAESYLAALAVLDGDPAFASADREAYLTGPALDVSWVDAEAVARRTHVLTVSFHSADGQLVEIQDDATRRFVGNGGPALRRDESAVAVLVQVDGTWHLRHRVITRSSTVAVDPDVVGLADAVISSLASAAFFGDVSALSNVTPAVVLMSVCIAVIVLTLKQTRRERQQR